MPKGQSGRVLMIAAPLADHANPASPASHAYRQQAFSDQAYDQHRPAAADEGAALMQRIAAHDRQAFECFYRATIGRVFGLALRITRNRPTAEEVAEDVYVQLWHRADGFDPERGSSLAWTLTICRSRALDALRRADPAILDEDPAARLDACLDARFDAPVNLGGNPQDLLHASQQNAALHGAIQRLQPQQRQLLSLAYFRDMSHAELAAHTGLALGTVKSCMRRTLLVLRADLGHP
jgi:RNA polymerase sigma factor (sigma-70 family)